MAAMLLLPMPLLRWQWHATRLTPLQRQTLTHALTAAHHFWKAAAKWGRGCFLPRVHSCRLRGTASMLSTPLLMALAPLAWLSLRLMPTAMLTVTSLWLRRC